MLFAGLRFTLTFKNYILKIIIESLRFFEIVFRPAANNLLI
jgi:hypothetical protein